MANLLSTYSVNHRAIGAEYKRVGYLANGWNAVRRWNSRSAAIQSAGIAGPSTDLGSWEPVPVKVESRETGYRRYRYRYMDSTTGYVSNPSEEIGGALDTQTGLMPIGDPTSFPNTGLRFLIGAATAVLGPGSLAFTATTITRSSGSWISDGFAVGDYITLASCEDAANNGNHLIRSLTATEITVLYDIHSGIMTVNAADTSATWQRAAKGRIQPSTDSKVDKIILEATTVCFFPTKKPGAGPISGGVLTIGTSSLTRTGYTETANGWVSDGFEIGDLVNINSPEDAANNRHFGPIKALTQGALAFSFGLATANADDATANWEPYRVEPVGDDSTWYTAGVALNTASTIDSTLYDADLENRRLPYTDYGHQIPPVTKNLLSHRERLWCYGSVVHEVGTATFTNNSTTVAQGSTSPDWNTEALGAAAGSSAVTWLIQRGTEEPYEISHFTGTNIILKKAYAGVTGSNVAYKIFTQANVIWVSQPGYPESFDLGLYLNGPNPEGSGDIVAGIGHGPNVIFFSTTGMTRFSFNTDPFVDGYYVPISNKAGALSQRVVVEIEGVVYTMDYRGWHKWSGAFPEKISRPLGSILPAIDFTKSDRFHACYLPESRAIRWWVVYSGDSYPKNYVQFDIDTGAWSTGTYLQAITDSRLVHQGQGPRLFLLDENGHSWWGETGLADGVPAANSHAIVTGALSTNTIIQTSTVLPTTGVGLAGAFCSRKITAGVTESRRIASNTAGAITLASAFSGIPAAGDELWIGAIPSKLKTRAFGFYKDLKSKTRTGVLAIAFKPCASTRYLQVRVYEDYSSTAKTWSVARNNATGLTKPGSNTRYPISDFLVNVGLAGGLVTMNVGDEWRRYYTLELEIEEPDADFELIGVEFDGQALQEIGL